LGTYDLKDIKESGALFIRKVSDRIDHNLVTLLPVHDPKEIPSISWPKEVKMIEKPDWKKSMKEIDDKLVALLPVLDHKEIHSILWPKEVKMIIAKPEKIMRQCGWPAALFRLREESSE
jgi:hypothetical protein